MGAPHGNKNASGPHKKGWYGQSGSKSYLSTVAHVRFFRPALIGKKTYLGTKRSKTQLSKKRTSLSTQHKVLAKYTRKMEKQYGRGY